MRRSLIVTVAASTIMVLLAMLVPMAMLVKQYALEDRIARAALEVQATETVVSGQDKGAVAVYLDSINSGRPSVATTVLYPDGTSVGPYPGEDRLVRQARATGRARVDDVAGGAQILVPVALGGSSASARETPVIRVNVEDRWFAGSVGVAWAVLAALGAVLLGGSIVVADRLGRSFVQPIRALATGAQQLAGDGLMTRIEPKGPAEVQEVATALNLLVDRVEQLLERERENVAELSHRLRTPVTALRLRVESLADPAERDRVSADVDSLARMVDDIIREAKRSQREGLVPRADATAILRSRTDFWRPLAEDQGRRFEVSAPPAGLLVQSSAADLEAMIDALLDNVFSYSPEGTPIGIHLGRGPDGAVILVIEDGGPGFPAQDLSSRGVSGSGSTGLGLSIVRRTAEESGGDMRLERSPLGGARVVVRLGPAS